MAGYGLVQVVREFCQKFGVIIPFKALSCATLVTLGADEVLMTEMGQLSPIDPSVEHPLGPTAVAPAPQAVPRVVPISVEDVANYFELAKSEEVGLKSEEALARVFERLAAKNFVLRLPFLGTLKALVGIWERFKKSPACVCFRQV